MNNIKVTNLENNYSWEKSLANNEIQQVKSLIEGKSTVNFIKAAFFPIRTNNLNNFSKDFFLPTTINHAIKINNTVAKIFAVLASLVFDVFTSPFRVLTAVPRIISNAIQEENLFKKYLMNEGVSKELLNSDRVRVKLNWETLEGNQSISKRHIIEKNVNFIETPSYKGSHFIEELN